MLVSVVYGWPLIKCAQKKLITSRHVIPSLCYEQISFLMISRCRRRNLEETKPLFLIWFSQYRALCSWNAQECFKWKIGFSATRFLKYWLKNRTKIEIHNFYRSGHGIPKNRLYVQSLLGMIFKFIFHSRHPGASNANTGKIICLGPGFGNPTFGKLNIDCTNMRYIFGKRCRLIAQPFKLHEILSFLDVLFSSYNLHHLYPYDSFDTYKCP